jgi:hypothetical protein
VIGVFRYGAGAAGVTGDEEAMPARVFLAGLDLGGGAASSARLSPRGFLYDGRLWSGLSGALSLSGGRVGFENARDPSGRHRMALAAAGRQGRRVQFRLSYTGGAPGFVNPLGSDSEHQPVTSHLIDTGSNENRSETAVLVRASPVRRLALELEVRGAVDRSTVRRSWDRPVGTGILRIEASPGGGWSLAGETRIENRGAPGPSAEADAPVRRHSARLTAGWEKGRAHLRFDWQGRFDLELPPGGAGTATLSQVQDLVALRGRWPLSRLLWLAGGVAQYRLPPAAPAVLYEERPANLPPGVFVRGAEDRVHGAFGFVTGMFEIGSFLSRRRDRSSGELNVSWGLMFGVARGRP